MNIRMILKSLGIVIIVEAICMIPSLIVSIVYGDNGTFAFVYSIIICLVTGLAMYRIKANKKFMPATVFFCCLKLGYSIGFGSLPYIFSSSITSFIDAVFETVSGSRPQGPF